MALGCFRTAVIVRHVLVEKDLGFAVIQAAFDDELIDFFESSSEVVRESRINQ